MAGGNAEFRRAWRCRSDAHLEPWNYGRAGNQCRNLLVLVLSNWSGEKLVLLGGVPVSASMIDVTRGNDVGHVP